MSSRWFKYSKKYGVLKACSLYYRTRKNAGLTTINLPGIRTPVFLRANTSDRRTFDKIFIEDEYALKLNFTPQFIIDGGANVGHASIYFANRFPNAKIYAVEPEPGNVQLLRKNTSAYPNVTVLAGGLWNRNTHLQIENPDAQPWAFRLIETTEEKNSFSAITIPSLLEQSGAEYIDIVKLDIEGGERILFADPACQLWLERTRVLIVELHERYVPGCELAFFEAVSQHRFSSARQGENYVLIRDAL